MISPCAETKSARLPAPHLRRRTTESFIGIVSNVHRVLIEYRAFKRPGSDLLSHALRHSTIGAEGLNGRVRNGIGCIPLAITTRPFKRTNPEPARACTRVGKFPDRQIKFASSEFRFARVGCRQASWRFPLRARSLSCLFTRVAHVACRSPMPASGGRCLNARRQTRCVEQAYRAISTG